MLETPILFVIFNRPQTTEKVFAEIKKAQPKKLFITADGPRTNKSGEKENCQLARDVVMNSIDWDCDVKTFFRETNVGCKIAVTTAINWFFDHVEDGIILEDDCLPAKSFFNYCSVLLEKYRGNENIYMISGQSAVYNIQNQLRNAHESYYFSKYTPIWGWATWRSRWNRYNDGLENVSFSTIASNLNAQEKLYWKDIFKEAKNNKSEILQEGHLSPWRGWDYRWTFTVMKNNGLSIVPYNNLISNIGFDENASHTKSVNDTFANNPVQDIFHINHPAIMDVNEKCDEYYFNYQIGAKDYKPAPLSRRLKNMLPPPLKEFIKENILKKVS